MISEFLRRRAAFDDLGHRIGIGLCILIAAATVILLTLSFDPRYDLAYQAAGFLGAVIFAGLSGLLCYVSARALARLAHRVKYGRAKDQLGWRGEPGPHNMTSNVIALIGGAALAATGMLFELFAQVAAGFPHGAAYAIGRLAAACLTFLAIGYAVTRAIVR